MQTAEADIPARNLRFNIREHAQRRWLGGDAIRTAYADSFSIFLPEGERFFIRSLKHYLGVIDDPSVRAQIRDYASQEAFHTREHEAYNQAMRDLGFDVDSMEAPVRRALEFPSSPLLALAETCAIEHMTATFSVVFLRDMAILEDAAPAYRRLWMWHALEELEHQAVALNVFNAVTKDLAPWKRYLLRTGALSIVAWHFVFILARNMKAYAKQDGVKIDLAFWRRFFWIAFGNPGYMRRSGLAFLSYYKPGFTGTFKATQPLIAKTRAWLEREIKSGVPRTITVG